MGFIKAILVFTFGLLFNLKVEGQKGISPKTKIWGATVSLPYANAYRHYDYGINAAASKAGFIGFGMALFYKPGKNKISLNYGLTSDMPAPFGPIDFGHEGTRSQIEARFIDLFFHKYLFYKLYFIGGINTVRYKYQLISYVDSIPGYEKHDDSFGLSTGLEFAVKKNFSIAALYRPALVSQDIRQYKHVLGLDFRFAINILKK